MQNTLSTKNIAFVGFVGVLAVGFIAASVMMARVANAAVSYGTVRIQVSVSGGTAKASDFTFHIKKNNSTDTGTVSASGNVILFGTLTPGDYTVTETGTAGYGPVWSGDCSSHGIVTISANMISSCIATVTFGQTGTGTGGGSTTTRTDRTRPAAPVRPTR